MPGQEYQGEIRSSLIWVASEAGVQTFRDIRDVPPALRRRIEASTQSPNAAYMVIADKSGRELIDPILSETEFFTSSTVEPTPRKSVPTPPTAWVVAWVWGALFMAWAVAMILR